VYYKFDEKEKAETGDTSVKADTAGTAHPELQQTKDPFADLPNLLKNGDFEELEKDGTFPATWQRNDRTPPKGVKYSLESSPEIVHFGKYCARLDVDKDVPMSWRGWTQRVPVDGGNSYFVQGWLKTKDMSSVRIHIHFLEADGKNCEMSSVNQDVAGTSDWTRVAEVMKAPFSAKYMVIHLTTNSSGTVWHDNISVFDGLFAEQTGRDSYQNIPKDKNGLAVWQVPAVVKVFPQTIPGIALKNERPHFYIEAAGNEKEPLQLAFRSTGKPQSLKIKVDAPKHSGGFKLDKFEIRTVGYVPIDYPSSYYSVKTPKWYRKTPTSAPGCDGWVGLFPDPLLESDTVQLKSNQSESAWGTWSIPKNAPAGTYTGNINIVNNEDKTVYSKPLVIKVFNFSLPDENHISAIYDVRHGRNQLWGKSTKEWYPEMTALMAENRLSPDTVGVVPKVERKDGKFVFDWTEFDKRCEWCFNELKVRVVYTPNELFYSFGWGHPPKNMFGEKPYEGEWPFSDADFSKIRPEYKKMYQDLLREFWNHIKEKGWEKRFVLYVSDEPNFWKEHIIEQMKAVCDMIHEVDKNIPIYCSTWHHIPKWKDSLDVWGIGHYGIVLPEVMKEIKETGSRIWFTTDGMLCLDTPYNAIERLLPHYCYKYGADAYEFWGVAWLTYDPYQYGSHAYIWQSSTPGEYYWVRYPNGDGYLLYPPQSGKSRIVESIRFGQAREGVEDYEYLYMLEQLIAEAKQKGKNTAAAEAALQQAMELVTCPTPIGRFSSRILPNPQRLYEVRHQVAEAIEMLKK
ncbi:MAG: DUF4091 domain-containing protein, partial [Planctomycetaceae bacterium]|nr:DUF4091 domain-containing protein [Planctomycetaceae bacterium]